MKKVKITITDGNVSWDETYDIDGNINGTVYMNKKRKRKMEMKTLFR